MSKEYGRHQIGKFWGLKSLLVWSAALPFVLLSAQAARQSQNPGAAPAASAPRAFLNQYCVTCHNDRAKTAGLMLDKMDVTHVPQNAEVWEKVVRKLRAGMMPPSGVRRPDGTATETFLGWLETELDRSASAKPNPGSPALHRLNRTEYGNVIRDLLALEVDATSLLPADDSSSGFDNNADSLNVSSALMERYIAAAAKISRLAIGDLSITPTEKTYAVAADLTQEYHVRRSPFWNTWWDADSASDSR
jgi:cytochrome c5